MNKKLIDRLKKLGLDDNQIEKLQTLGASSVEDLQELTETDLTEMGLPILKARRVIREFSGQPPQPSAEPSTASPEEEVKVLNTTQAPPGTTAVKKPLRRSGDLARQLGLPEARYIGCSNCRNDLDLAAEEEGLSVDQFKQCPYCTAVFVAEQAVYCYSCGQKMTQNGQCLNCGANASDDTGLKAMTILVRREQGSTGRVARATAQSLLGDKGYAAQIAAQAKAEHWIEKSEEGPQGSMPPFGNVASSTSVGARGVNVSGRVGGSIVTGDGNNVGGDTSTRVWPARLSHPQTLALIDELGNFGEEDLKEVSRFSDVDHELFQYKPVSAFRRNLVDRHNRHSTVGKLMVALQKSRPTVNWAAVIGIVDEKAGTGDTIFDMSGRFDGATINIGTTHINRK
jgi:hypothetical protein